MKFSVVIPLYNKAPYVERALDSVVTQTVQEFEIVVVDDGSVDGGPDLVRKYPDPRVRLIQQANAGAAVTRNRGVAEARANLIAFLDADDKWDKDFLQCINFLVEEYPEAGLFATSYRMFDGTDTQFPNIQNLAIPLAGHGLLKNYLRTMLGPPPFYTSSTVVRKEIVQKIGGFPVGIALVDVLDEELAGVQGFGTLLVVPGSQSVSTSLRFALPTTVLSAAANPDEQIYHLKVQKQPGTIAPGLTIRIHLPENATLRSMPDKAVVQDENILLETNLQTDVELTIVFALP